MGSVVPLKKSANSAYLELKNLLSKKLQKVEVLIEQKLKIEYIHPDFREYVLEGYKEYKDNSKLHLKNAAIKR